MYCSIYRVQSNTRRLPIQALFGFMLKLVGSYPPLPLRVSVWWFVLGVYLGLPHVFCGENIYVCSGPKEGD